MFLNKLRILGLLLYKNYLVRKRYWKSALFFEVLATLALFLSIWFMRGMMPTMGEGPKESQIYNVRSADDYVLDAEGTVLVAPDNQFAQNLARRVQKCLHGHYCKANHLFNYSLFFFNTEADGIYSVY